MYNIILMKDVWLKKSTEKKNNVVECEKMVGKQGLIINYSGIFKGETGIILIYISKLIFFSNQKNSYTIT